MDNQRNKVLYSNKETQLISDTLNNDVVVMDKTTSSTNGNGSINSPTKCKDNFNKESSIIVTPSPTKIEDMILTSPSPSPSVSLKGKNVTREKKEKKKLTSFTCGSFSNISSSNMSFRSIISPGSRSSFDEKMNLENNDKDENFTIHKHQLDVPLNFDVDKIKESHNHLFYEYRDGTRSPLREFPQNIKTLGLRNMNKAYFKLCARNSIARSPAFDEDSIVSDYLERLNVDSTDEGTEVMLPISNFHESKATQSYLKENRPLCNGASEVKDLPGNTIEMKERDENSDKSHMSTPKRYKPAGQITTCTESPQCFGPPSFCGSISYVVTPDRPKMRQTQYNFSSFNPSVPDSCCGNVLFDPDMTFRTRRDFVAKTIEKLLATEEPWCNGWHIWGLYLDEEKHPDLPSNPEIVKAIFQNRAGSLSEKSKRINMLQQNMNPFYGNEYSSLNESYQFQKSTSLHSNKASQAKTQKATSTNFLNIGACISPDPKKSLFDVSNEDELCYDSDPGITSHRRGFFTENDTHDNSSFESPCNSRRISNPNHKKSRLDSDNNQLNYHIDRMNLHDERMSSSLVQDTLNRSMTLMWHPNPIESKKASAPTSVIAWIERGQQIRSTLIQPKFLWKRKYVDYENDYMTRKMISNDHMYGVDLLDISHVLTAKKIDRDIYPLARTKCCFIIEYFTKRALFEASSESERDRIVLCLKLTVARLGSMIIVNDNTFFEEFFHETEPKFAPGNSPYQE